MELYQEPDSWQEESDHSAAEMKTRVGREIGREGFRAKDRRPTKEEKQLGPGGSGTPGPRRH